MAEVSPEFPRFTAEDLPVDTSLEAVRANRFAEAALERHKREGLELAVRARWIALAVVAVLLPILNPDWPVLYYEALLLVLAGIGWLQRRVGRVGRSGAEMAVMAADLAIMVTIVTVPNPFDDNGWPTAMILRFDTFDYLFIILAVGTLCYSWRTILAMGNWTAGLFGLALGAMWLYGTRSEDLAVATQAAFGFDPELASMLDPNAIQFDIRLQQIVVFLIVAAVLAISIRRFNRLLLGQAQLERERTNLARYFSPNVVAELSGNDEPLKQIRAHDVAVIFVDIKGFTTYAATRDPEEVIATLRSFHAMMERAVFAQNGTLDKYLGDGLMASFGTPLPKADDLRRAYHCARRMLVIAREWNGARAAAGEPPLEVSVGLHYGPAVLGDIGGDRLEYAVIGNTVNVASRLEGLTRPLDARLAVSGTVRDRLPQEEVADLTHVGAQTIRGIDGTMDVWCLH